MHYITFECRALRQLGHAGNFLRTKKQNDNYVPEKKEKPFSASDDNTFLINFKLLKLFTLFACRSIIFLSMFVGVLCVFLACILVSILYL